MGESSTTFWFNFSWVEAGEFSTVFVFFGGDGGLHGGGDGVGDGVRILAPLPLVRAIVDG
jgi:hypothetical protein